MAIHKPPFSLDLTRRNTLAVQMENSLRQAIASGRYRPGDALPTVREWAKMLGVSMRVPEAVIPRLVKEGLIVARPRHGCIVAPRGATVFRGHVLAVLPPEVHFLNSSTVCNSMSKRLEDAGYLVSSIRVRRDGRGRYDFQRLRLSLRQSVDLAVFLLREASAAQCAKALGVPFVTIHDGHLAGEAGHVAQSEVAALDEMARDFKARGVRSICVACKNEPVGAPAVNAFRNAGLKVETMPIPIDPLAPPELRIEAILRAARDTFELCLSRKRSLPDAIHFSDDFRAQGAVPVLLAHGVRIPRDVMLSTVSNYGRGPVFPFPTPKIEYNSYEYGQLLADGVLAYFDGGAFPEGIAFSPHYVSE